MPLLLPSRIACFATKPRQRRCTLQVQGGLSEEEIKIRVNKARNLIRFWERLVPFDKRAFNGAKLLWQSLEDIPSYQRYSLLPLLNSRDIRRLWTISTDRYRNTPTANSPFDFPEKPEEIVRFEGRNALWIGNNCSRVLFVEQESYEVLGRAIYPFEQFAKSIYPLYFRLNPKSERIPATGEVYDFSFEYLSQEETPITSQDSSELLPEAKDPVFPFNGRLTEYIRPIGPGCYVGIGWKAPRPELNDLGRRFLTFVLFKV